MINASPDLREQINRQEALHPREGLRSSPIAGVVLTNGDVDATAGLLHLRERTPFVLYAHARVLEVLDENPIFGVLSPEFVSRHPLALEETVVLRDHRGSEGGIRLTPFAVPGKVALYREDSSKGEDFGTEEGDTLGVEISDTERSARILYVANCAAVTDGLRGRCEGADLLFFDGTLWRDDELITRKEGRKTGHRMGHISMSGESGAIMTLSDVGVGRKVFIHINNTNPVLMTDSAERGEVEAAGWEVAYDGMQVTLG